MASSVGGFPDSDELDRPHFVGFEVRVAFSMRAWGRVMSTAKAGATNAFLEVRSFEPDSIESEAADFSAETSFSPFLSLYSSDGETFERDFDSEDRTIFLNEMYEEEFNEALNELVDEASRINSSGYGEAEVGGGVSTIANHFRPLEQSLEAAFEALSSEYAQRDARDVSEAELDRSIENLEGGSLGSPALDNFRRRFRGIAKKIGSKAISLAKKGVKFLGKFALGKIFAKLKALIKPLLRRVLAIAVRRLPANLQPAARYLATKLPFLNEADSVAEENEEFEGEFDSTANVDQLQLEFNEQLANVVYATSDAEQDLEVSRSLAANQTAMGMSVDEIDQARSQFVDRLAALKEGEDPTPAVQEFIPAIMPALRVGVRVAGRKRIVDFLAKAVSRLIQKFVGPQYAPSLSRAIVDAGLKLVSLESADATDPRIAAEAMANVVEEATRSIVAEPEYVFENDELLEGAVLEAVEEAAAANLPPVLSEEVYRRRPELRQAVTLRGAWVLRPLRGRRRYKKFTRAHRVKVSPHKLREIESFGGETVGQFLEEQNGLAPGEEIEAEVELFESIPGTMLSDIARSESEHVEGEGAESFAEDEFHPLTPEAATALLGEEFLGRRFGKRYLDHRRRTAIGQRFYRLRFPRRHRLPLAIGPAGASLPRRQSGVRIGVNFPANTIFVHIFLSEVRAQEAMVRLRQGGRISAVAQTLRRFLDRGVNGAISSGCTSRFKIIHEGAPPGPLAKALLRRLPSTAITKFSAKIKEWALQAALQHLKTNPQSLIAAAEDGADGLTIAVAIKNPPGLALLRGAMRGNAASLASMNFSDGAPEPSVRIMPGFAHV